MNDKVVDVGENYLLSDPWRTQQFLGLPKELLHGVSLGRCGWMEAGREDMSHAYLRAFIRAANGRSFCAMLTGPALHLNDVLLQCQGPSPA